MKKFSIIDLQLWYPSKKSTQPMLSLTWEKASDAALQLMKSSNYTFAKDILEDETIAKEVKELLYSFCQKYITVFEKDGDQQGVSEKNR